MSQIRLQVTDLHKTYLGKVSLRAVDGLSFQIEAGKTYALVGESGCGKSTTGRMVLRLGTKPDRGKVELDGVDIYTLKGKALRTMRQKMQMIFQDPYGSLSPRMMVGKLILEPVVYHKLVEKEQRQDYLDGILRQCGLDPGVKNRYPHAFSGGQRQRLSIARALSLQPEVLVCDEPVSALDVSVQAQIVNLLLDLQQQKNLSYLFISHDLSVVEQLAHRVGVMYAGRLMEEADREELFAQPCHPYTRLLLSAVLPSAPGRPRPYEAMPEAVVVEGLGQGCVFAGRCPYRFDRCLLQRPELFEIAPGHTCACFLFDEKKTPE